MSAFLTLLWLHFFWCLVPSWQDGLYYSYGWLVAPLALGFAWRRQENAETLPPTSSGCRLGGKTGNERWSTDAARATEGRKYRNTETRKHGSTALSPCLIGIYLVAMVPLRMVEIGDPSWRIPILLHALLLVGLTAFMLWREGGWARLRWFLPVIIFALTAVPLPWQIEQSMVRQLTGSVTRMTQEVFLLRGIPVERAGETLHLGGEAVEVGDACSGIRSLQSLIMAALFFGELLWLGLGRRLALVGVAGVCALLTNTGRAYYLAQVQFSKGEEAAAAVHDMAGHVAFGVSCLVLFLAAKLMSERRRGRVVVRKKLKT